MANPEHLRILKQGVEVWNRWREENPDIRPQLKYATLRGNALAGANLQSSDLRAAQLRVADLVGTELWGANLAGADLTGADLAGARLSCANLRKASLSGSDLRRSDLQGSFLISTNMRGARMPRAKFGETVIDNVDLSCIEDLASSIHHGPSGVSMRTLEATASGITREVSRLAVIEVFYRGAGLPEHLIDYFRSRIGEPSASYSSFISYSHIDQEFARCLHDQLQPRGIRCWLDEHDMKPGDRILDVVNDAIRLHDKILLCCSEASLESWWVRDEIRKAQERERREDRDIIIPLMVDRYLLDSWEDGLAADLRSRLAADFTGWGQDNAKFEEQFERVVRALRPDEAREKALASNLR